MALLRNRKVSPIRGESEERRQKGDEFLSSFNAPVTI